MTRYTIGAGSRLRVTARSRLHDTSTVWDAISGEVEADAATLATAGARGRFVVDMTKFDAGDWLKNRKLRKDYELEQHARAELELTSVSGVVADGDRFKATARGVLRWRGKEVDLELVGDGADQGLERRPAPLGLQRARARFLDDLRELSVHAFQVRLGDGMHPAGCHSFPSTTTMEF